MDDIFGGIVSVIILALIGLFLFCVYHAAQATTEQRNKFMVECKQDHKEYECTHMWRNSSDNGPVIVPVYMPTGR